jgi:hypothetical protein
MAHDMSFAAETTTDADYANQRNFFKVELWTKDDKRVAGYCTPADMACNDRRLLCLQGNCRAKPGSRL